LIEPRSSVGRQGRQRIGRSPLLAMVVEEVTTRDRVVDDIRLRPVAMPFFASPDPVLVLAPPDGLEPPTHSLGRNRSIH
jgi:hypothetical protein